MRLQFTLGEKLQPLRGGELFGIEGLICPWK
jgi:hypothetical protein